MWSAKKIQGPAYVVEAKCGDTTRVLELTGVAIVFSRTQAMTLAALLDERPELFDTIPEVQKWIEEDCLDLDDPMFN